MVGSSNRGGVFKADMRVFSLLSRRLLKVLIVGHIDRLNDHNLE